MDVREKFLRILDIELEDLAGHLETMIETYREREHRLEVSEHVAMANEAVYRNEQRALEYFCQIIETTDAKAHPDLDGLIAWLHQRFDEELEAAGLSRAASGFSDRKMHRVEQYVKHGSTP